MNSDDQKSSGAGSNCTSKLSKSESPENIQVIAGDLDNPNPISNWLDDLDCIMQNSTLMEQPDENISVLSHSVRRRKSHRLSPRKWQVDYSELGEEQDELQQSIFSDNNISQINYSVDPEPGLAQAHTNSEKKLV